MYQQATKPVVVDGGVALHWSSSGLVCGRPALGVYGTVVGKNPQNVAAALSLQDGYGAYAAFFSSWQHRPCEKFDGGTSTVEGVKQSLRHRCGALVRRTSARCRDRGLLDKRIALAVQAHNHAGERRLKRRAKSAQKKR
jgi:hypothetical protein